MTSPDIALVCSVGIHRLDLHNRQNLTQQKRKHANVICRKLARPRAA